MGAERVTVIDADDARAERLTESLQPAFTIGRLESAEFAKLVPTLAEADGVVHATPTGMAAHAGIAVPDQALVPSLWVADIVYRPLETELRARRRAAPDARRSTAARWRFSRPRTPFELFTGVTPDVDRMLAHFHELAAAEGPADE